MESYAMELEQERQEKREGKAEARKIQKYFADLESDDLRRRMRESQQN